LRARCCFFCGFQAGLRVVDLTGPRLLATRLPCTWLPPRRTLVLASVPLTFAPRLVRRVIRLLLITIILLAVTVPGMVRIMVGMCSVRPVVPCVVPWARVVSSVFVVVVCPVVRVMLRPIMVVVVMMMVIVVVVVVVMGSVPGSRKSMSVELGWKKRRSTISLRRVDSERQWSSR